ncbi:MAG TPA: hypothetical protein VKR24_06405 [Candidatus Limnocylindrales bacterium]|nr:hypothetical protein [Candidatus Limnocylindrales bacterium]
MNFKLSPRLGRVTLALGAAGLLAIGSLGSVYAADPTTSTNSTTAAAVHHFCIPEWAAVVAHPGNVDILRAAGDCEINRRFVTLDGLTYLVNHSDVLTADHKTDLLTGGGVNPASFEWEHAGLTTLKVSIDADTTIATLRTDIAKIAPDYRVYLLVVPKTHIVAAADGAAKVSAKFGPLATELQNLINQAKADGKDVTAAQAKLDDLNAKVGQANGLIAPVAGTVLPLSPADWNSGAAKPVFQAARTSLHQARGLLVDARQDAHQIIVLLGS